VPSASAAQPTVALIAEQLRRRVPGGIGTYVRGLVKGLVSLEDRPAVTLVASRPPAGPDPLAGLGLPVRSSALPGPALTRLWDRGLGTGLVAFAGVVHGTSMATPIRAKVPTVETVHDLAWQALPEAFPPRGRRWHEAALRRAIEKAAAIVVPSTATADALARQGVHPSRVTVITEGCDHLPPPDKAGTDARLAALGVTTPYLLSVSTLEPRKNLGTLLSAYDQVRGRLPGPWPLVVVGPVGWGDALRPVQGVKLAGVVDDGVLAGLYAAARCLVYVPLLEGWGLPPVEAMAAGLPVVASPMPSTAGAALEVDATDMAALGDAMVTAAGAEPCRAELVERGLRRAAELTWDEAARRHVELWTTLA
jgi:glycosyltransferase involved in cell wall biosynthesis